jgi:hypothetical protein
LIGGQLRGQGGQLLFGDDPVVVRVGLIEEPQESLVGDFILGELAIPLFVKGHHSRDQRRGAGFRGASRRGAALARGGRLRDRLPRKAGNEQRRRDKPKSFTHVRVSKREGVNPHSAVAAKPRERRNQLVKRFP